MEKQELKAYFFVSVAILAWGSSAAVAKLLVGSGLEPAQTIFFTSLIATTVLFFLALFQNKLAFFRQYCLKDYLKMAFTGFWGFQVYLLCFYSAITLMSAQETYIINYLWPIAVVLFASAVLKERLGFKKLVALIISFLGVVIVATKGNAFSFHLESYQGVVLAVVAAMAYGLFSVLDKKFGYEKVVENLFFYLANLVTVTTILIFTKKFIWFDSLNLQQLTGLMWMGTVVAVMGSVFWLLALKHGNTARMSGLIFLAPFVSLIYIRFLVGEKILVSSVTGLVIIVFGILVQSVDFGELFLRASKYFR